MSSTALKWLASALVVGTGILCFKAGQKQGREDAMEHLRGIMVEECEDLKIIDLRDYTDEIEDFIKEHGE
jgi:hypothetical protein